MADLLKQAEIFIFEVLYQVKCIYSGRNLRYRRNLPSCHKSLIIFIT